MLLQHWLYLVFVLWLLPRSLFTFVWHSLLGCKVFAFVWVGAKRVLMWWAFPWAEQLDSYVCQSLCGCRAELTSGMGESSACMVPRPIDIGADCGAPHDLTC